MKRTKLIAPLTILATLFFCATVYFFLPREVKWALSSIIDVPVCASRVANKIKIEPSFSSVKAYILESLETGMTSDEVHATLEKIAPIEVEKKPTLDKKEFYEVIPVKSRHNPFGNIVLYVYYSQEGNMINVVNPHTE